jgi:hypothetical protein
MLVYPQMAVAAAQRLLAVKRRNHLIALFVLSLVASVLLLDLAIVFLPAIIPDATTGERESISQVLRDHAGQLLVMIVAIGSAAVAMRQQGGHVLDPDEDDK